MIKFFVSKKANTVYAVGLSQEINSSDLPKFTWLFGGAELHNSDTLEGFFVGPRKEMITPWATNAVEITQNMGLEGIYRIEEFMMVDSENAERDPMLQVLYKGLDQTIYTVEHAPEKVEHIDDIAAYNQQEGLALSDEEIEYLEGVAKDLGRQLTDSEIFGFSQ